MHRVIEIHRHKNERGIKLMKKILRIKKKNHIQHTLDGEQLELKIVRKKNRIEVDVYDTTIAGDCN